MKAGDVIVSFDGEKIRSARQLRPARRGDSRRARGRGHRFARRRTRQPEGRAHGGVRLPVWRTGVEADYQFSSPDSFTMTLPKFRQFEQFRNERGEFPAISSPRPFSFFGRLDRGRLGVGVQDLTGQLGEYFGASGGVLVTEVDDNTPAKTAGIKAGDVITQDQRGVRARFERPSPPAVRGVGRDPHHGHARSEGTDADGQDRGRAGHQPPADPAVEQPGARAEDTTPGVGELTTPGVLLYASAVFCAATSPGTTKAAS